MDSRSLISPAIKALPAVGRADSAADTDRTSDTWDPPLAGVRVIDTTRDWGRSCAQFLADLGADVERPTERRLEPGDFAGVDIWVGSPFRDELEREPSHDEVREIWPHLVVVSITPFGLTGPYRDWAATDWVIMAMSGCLSKSGLPGRRPMMPPGRLADEVAASQAAWCVLVVYWNRLRTGRGDHLDFSVFEAIVQAIDPPFGSIGTAAAASGGSAETRGRPEARHYPIFPCADGFVRVVVLSARQWRNLFEWLGMPSEFAGPEYASTGARVEAADRLYPAIGRLVADTPMWEVVGEGQRRGVPVAPVLSPRQVLEVGHFRQRGTFTEEVTAGREALVPRGYLLIDGHRARSVRAADTPVHCQPPGRPADPTLAVAPGRPLEGLRVLDLGVIVMGGEAGKLFADQGADVIKVENSAFPDGARLGGMTPSFAAGHRGSRSIGIDLRHPSGKELFERLVALSDVVLTNFKPGTLESLGLGYDRIRHMNPAAVLVTSSAMGESGPWRDWMGYGPLVRCVTGLTYLWRDPEIPGGFGDATTIFPDHFVARVVVAGALAALLRRERTGRGGHVECSQAEAVVIALANIYRRESLEAGSAQPLAVGDSNAPWGVFPCAGNDEWCVITVRDEADWARLVDAVGRPDWATAADLATPLERVAAATRIRAGIEAFTTDRTPAEVAALLQAAGVPAAPMFRPTDLRTDPHLHSRCFFTTMRQPGLTMPWPELLPNGQEILVDSGPTRAENMLPPEGRPAPLIGQHTRELARELLALSEEEIDRLVTDGVLEEAAE